MDGNPLYWTDTYGLQAGVLDYPFPLRLPIPLITISPQVAIGIILFAIPNTNIANGECIGNPVCEAVAYNENAESDGPKQCPVKDLDPLHSPETIGNRPDLEKLSDKELLDWVNNPNDGEGLTVNENGKLIQGNSRAQELIKRSKDPNSSITPDTQVTVHPSPATPNKDIFWDL